MYIICGDEEYFINQEINKIIKDNKEKKLENFYCEENDLTNLLTLIDSTPLFQEKKLLIIYDLPFLEKTIAKKDLKIAQFIIEAIKKNTADIFIFVNSKLPSKDKIPANIFTDFCLSNTTNQTIFLTTKKLENKNLYDAIESITKKNGGQIEYSAIIELTLKLSNNLTIIENEIIKLLSNSKKITKEMIIENVEEVLVKDAFGFVNSFETNDFYLIWKQYKRKLNEGVEITNLIGQISQSFILANQIYSFLTVDKDLKNFASEYKVNQYRAKKIQNLIYKLGIKKIQSMIIRLANLDKEIKDGLIDAQLGFEKFLINFFI
ncbi:DNA polymerase III subunit delta [Mycoplasma sp. Mirounga ES2805-ORL]|uniref:DNA polymerase III subunit delta n=1 Tax=Mycoplasma sp. Mirounga ES2805-ORL TaxID=754514 RepID=UPI00197C91A7|nr:DNA polymerase III subunit delta [Mycoplasma sp. Mirounga ES2805-ORL]QSF13853.1 DNA polymerase III subunit delta [Mycoplasma sp. Mirounga ES2805-ORL]